jgi:hypothetical protein
MKLDTCRSCPGLIPRRASSCPHCGASCEPRASQGGLSGGGLAGRVARVATGGAVAITLMACYGAPNRAAMYPDMPRDDDGDGFMSKARGGNDCDDANPEIHPGATDTAGDGIDQDCDGADGTPGSGKELMVATPP